MVKEVSFDDLNFNISMSCNPFRKFIGYILDGVILGYIEYNDIYETIDIVNVFVREDARRRGIGFSLMNYLIVNNSDKRNITLEVNVNNRSAINLYEKCGFVITAIRKGYYNGVDGYLMERVL